MVRGRRSHDKQPTPYPRTARVNQVLREVVAEELETAVRHRRPSPTDHGDVGRHDARPASGHRLLELPPDEAAEVLAEERVNLQRQSDVRCG